LIGALIHELANATLDVCWLSANDFADQHTLADMPQLDLLVIEDLQHLPARHVDALIAAIDERCRIGLPTVFTAPCGPSELSHRGIRLPHRLTNRLAGGLVVSLQPMQTASRRRLLTVLAEQAGISVAPEIISWLARHLTGGGRQLEGAIRQLKGLASLQSRPLRLGDVRAHFAAQIEAKAPTIQRIADHVSGYYQVTLKQLASDRQSRDVLVPRQVSMYLARQLTSLSLHKIGKYFGGRDHKTVQHACRKIETSMSADAALGGAVREMRASLS
jgi:chromosomal replication initiator protein